MARRRLLPGSIAAKKRQGAERRTVYRRRFDPTAGRLAAPAPRPFCPECGDVLGFGEPPCRTCGRARIPGNQPDEATVAARKRLSRPAQPLDGREETMGEFLRRLGRSERERLPRAEPDRPF